MQLDLPVQRQRICPTGIFSVAFVVSISVADADDPSFAVAGRVAFPIITAITALRLVHVLN